MPLMTAALAGSAPQRQAALSALVALADGGDKWGAVEGGDGGRIISGAAAAGDAMMVENEEGSDAVGKVSEGGEGANNDEDEDGEEGFMGEEEMVEAGSVVYSRTCSRST